MVVNIMLSINRNLCSELPDLWDKTSPLAFKSNSITSKTQPKLKTMSTIAKYIVIFAK